MASSAHHIRLQLVRWGIVSLLWPIFFSTTATFASALTCCKCHPNGDASINLCLAGTESTCDELLTSGKNGNPNLKDTVCESQPLTEGTTCAPFGDPNNASAQCHLGPMFPEAYIPKTAANSDKTETKSSPYQPIVPQLNVQIPGLTFSSSVNVTDGKASLPFLAQYVAGIYRYLLGIAVIAAAVMIVYGGFLYIVGATFISISKGKTIIVDAVAGLLLTFGAWTILTLINPQTTNLQNINLQIVTPEREDIETIPISSYWKTLGQSETPTPPGGQSPPAPGSPGFQPIVPPEPNGTMKEGSCEFQINQAGLPTTLSIYQCAVNVIAKETGVDPCFMVVGINHESYLALPNSIGHDENTPTPYINSEGVTTQFPEYARFLQLGVTFKGKPVTAENKQLNDDIVDLTKDDLGLDPRFSHGVGLMQFTIKSICGETFTRKSMLSPYYGILAGAKHIRCSLTENHGMETQNYPGTISMAWDRYGGCYPTPTRPCPHPFNLTSMIVPHNPDPRRNRTAETYACMQSGNPFLNINPANFTICRGDFPLDREACREYVRNNMQEFKLNPNQVCNAYCLDPRMPVVCGSQTQVCRLRG